MDKCKNHPIRIAPVRCRRCHAPICLECRIQDEGGVFCSEECVEQFREFQARVQTIGFGQRRVGVLGLLKYAATVLVLVAVIYVALVFWLGTTDPGEMWRQAWNQITLLF